LLSPFALGSHRSSVHAVGFDPGFEFLATYAPNPTDFDSSGELFSACEISRLTLGDTKSFRGIS
jgi:hypothetical protein